jgi:hypothetical protein
MASKYAPGRQTWGRCQRCSMRFLLADLVFDGYMPGLRVCVDCYDAKHPQEFLQDTADPQGLWQPSPEFGPKGPTLRITSFDTYFELDWTEANPEGGARVESYTLSRQVSYDGGFTFTELAPIFTAPVVYDDFAAIVTEPLTFNDTTIQPGLTYQYQVTAYFGLRRYVPSNLVLGAKALILEYLTSRPYPYDFGDAIGTGFAMEPSAFLNPHDAATTAWVFTAGTVVDGLITYSFYAPEKLKTAFTFTAGTVVLGLITYSYYAPEKIKTAFTFTAGTVVTGLITYANYAPEPLKTAFQFTAGTVV